MARKHPHHTAIMVEPDDHSTPDLEVIHARKPMESISPSIIRLISAVVEALKHSVRLTLIMPHVCKPVDAAGIVREEVKETGVPLFYRRPQKDGPTSRF